LKGVFKYDYKAYLLCLVTAACFWLLNAMGGQYKTNINYPVRFVPDSNSSDQHLIKADIVFCANGSGWELLKRNLAYKLNPLELPISFVGGRDVFPSTKLLSYITPDLGRLTFRYLVTDSVHVVSKTILQKKVYLSLNQASLKIKSPFLISGKVYLEPYYITVTGVSSAVLSLPDTLNLLMGENINSSLDTLLDLRELFSSGIKIDYNKAHLMFDIAPFVKKERIIQAVLVGFPDSLMDASNPPTFKMEYFVAKDNQAVESKAKYKMILDYNMRDTVTGTVVPVLVDFPDYIREYTVSPSLFKLNHVH